MKKQIFALLLLLLLCGTAFADMDVYFLDVEQGDAAVLVSDGEVMLVDGGGNADSRKIYSFLLNTLGIDRIHLMAISHPSEEHIGGLPAALNAAEVETVLSPVAGYDGKSFEYLLRYASQSIVVPKAGDSYALGGARVTVLAPTETAHEDIRDNGLVLRVDYGNVSFLFMGDATAEVEEELLAGGTNLNCDVLKVGNHGGKDSSTQRFVNAVSPAFALLSVGDADSTACPSEETLERLSDAGAQICRTDQNGTVVFHTDGDTLTCETEKACTPDQEAQDENDSGEFSYVGNKNSRKFHTADCSSVGKMKEENKCFFSDRQQAVDQGYVPCKNCNP